MYQPSTLAHPDKPQPSTSLQEAVKASSTHSLLSFAQQSAADLEASLLLQLHAGAKSLCLLLATSETIEVASVPVGNILSVCPDHDHPKHHPVQLFWVSLPHELGIWC